MVHLRETTQTVAHPRVQPQPIQPGHTAAAAYGVRRGAQERAALRAAQREELEDVRQAAGQQLREALARHRQTLAEKDRLVDDLRAQVKAVCPAAEWGNSVDGGEPVNFFLYQPPPPLVQRPSPCLWDCDFCHSAAGKMLEETDQLAFFLTQKNPLPSLGGQPMLRPPWGSEHGLRR